LVTGASSGIGRAIAVRLAEQGYQIVVHYNSNSVEAEKTLQSIRAAGSDGRLMQFDISDTAACRQTLEHDLEQHGAYFGVVCNAGMTRDAAFPMLSETDWKQVIDVNLNGFYNVLQPVMMPMIRRRAPGRIVTISSVSGLMGNRGQANYSASKAGIIAATKSLAIELAKRKITVNCVAPGLIESDMTDDPRLQEMIKAIPLGRMGKPEEVAALVAFLFSPDAAYITRQVFSINGGLI
jgi:3-oxoacyl-[acyl-carrier protein] reductase